MGLRGIRLIQLYYLASPAFLILGLWWGTEIRVTFLTDLRARFIYYLLLGLLGLLTHFRPSAAPWVALGESALNLFLILAWILLPLYGIADDPLRGALGVPYTVPQLLISGGLAGGFFLIGFYQAQARLVERYPWLSGPGKGKGPGVR